MKNTTSFEGTFIATNIHDLREFVSSKVAEDNEAFSNLEELNLIQIEENKEQFKELQDAKIETFHYVAWVEIEYVRNRKKYCKNFTANSTVGPYGLKELTTRNLLLIKPFPNSMITEDTPVKIRKITVEVHSAPK